MTSAATSNAAGAKDLPTRASIAGLCALWLSSGCGAKTALQLGERDGIGADGAVDVTAPPPNPTSPPPNPTPSPPDGGPPSCAPLVFTIQTQQSCELDVAGPVDVEAFIQPGSVPRRVLAMDRWGAGHVAAWCDATTAGLLLEVIDLPGYLGQTPDPRVASVGYAALCNPGMNLSGLPGWVTYLGQAPPDRFQNDAGQLAAEFDALVWCSFKVPALSGWEDEIAEYVSVYGKGFMPVMDYLASLEEHTRLNDILLPTDIRFMRGNYGWDVLTVDEGCVPGMPP